MPIVTASIAVSDILDGATAGIIVIYQRNSSVPATPADSTDFDPADQSFTAPAGWFKTLAGATGSDTLYVSFASFNQNSTSLDWQTPVQFEGENGMDGDDGPRGPGRWNYRVGTTLAASYTQAQLDGFLANAVPGTNNDDPIPSDQLWLYASANINDQNPTAQMVYIYNGADWVEQDEVIDGNLLVTDTITGDKIVANTSITAPTLEGGVIRGAVIEAGILLANNSAFPCDTSLYDDPDTDGDNLTFTPAGNTPFTRSTGSLPERIQRTKTASVSGRSRTGLVIDSSRRILNVNQGNIPGIADYDDATLTRNWGAFGHYIIKGTVNGANNISAGTRPRLTIRIMNDTVTVATLTSNSIGGGTNSVASQSVSDSNFVGTFVHTGTYNRTQYCRSKFLGICTRWGSSTHSSDLQITWDGYIRLVDGHHVEVDVSWTGASSTGDLQIDAYSVGPTSETDARFYPVNSAQLVIPASAPVTSISEEDLIPVPVDAPAPTAPTDPFAAFYSYEAGDDGTGQVNTTTIDGAIVTSGNIDFANVAAPESTLAGRIEQVQNALSGEGYFLSVDDTLGPTLAIGRFDATNIDTDNNIAEQKGSLVYTAGSGLVLDGTLTAGAVRGGGLVSSAIPTGSDQGAYLDLDDGTFVFGNADEHLQWDGSNMTLSGVSIDANDLANLSALDGKIQGSGLQTYADNTAYAVGDVLISDNRLWQVNTAIPDTNTDAPEDGNSSFTEISPSVAASILTQAVWDAGTSTTEATISPAKLAAAIATHETPDSGDTQYTFASAGSGETGFTVTPAGGSAQTVDVGTFDRASSALTGTTVFSDIVVDNGVITNVATRALTVPDAANDGVLSIAADSGTTNDLFSANDSANNTLTISGGTDLASSVSDDTVTINHSNVTRTNNTSSSSPGYAGTFTAIDSITSSATGHITAVNTKTVTMPSAQTIPTPAILSNGSTPSLNSGITAAEIRTLIGAPATGDIPSVGNATINSVSSGDVTMSSSFTTNQSSNENITFTLGDGKVTAAKLGSAVVNFEKVAVQEMQNLVFDVDYTELNDTTPVAAGQIFVGTATTTRAANNAEWTSIRFIRISDLETAGRDITSIIDLFAANQSYIKLSNSDGSRRATFKVTSISDQTGFTILGVDGADAKQVTGTFGQGVTYTVSLQIKTDQVIDGDLVVTGSLKASDLTTTTLNAAQATIGDATIGNLVAEYAQIAEISADNIDTNVLNANAIQTRTIQSSTFDGTFSGDTLTGNGTTGWAIGKNGTAVFHNATVRGSLNADDITAGELSLERINNISFEGGGAGNIGIGYDVFADLDPAFVNEATIATAAGIGITNITLNDSTGFAAGSLMRVNDIVYSVNSVNHTVNRLFLDEGLEAPVAVGDIVERATGDTAAYNVALGNDILTILTDGSFNVGIGYQALEITTTGDENVGIGYKAGEQNLTASGNTYIGSEAGSDNRFGGSNVFIGARAAQYANPSDGNGNFNVAIGVNAGAGTLSSDRLDEQSSNVLIGHNTVVQAGGLNVGNTGDTVALGASSAAYGFRNVSIGFACDVGTTSAGVDSSVAIGNACSVSADDCVIIGSNAGSVNATTSSTRNVGLGYQSLGSLTSGPENVGLGTQAGAANTSGQGNTFIGTRSGFDNNTISYPFTTASITTGTDNVLIGSDTQLGAADDTNGIAIGIQAIGGDHSVAIGATAYAQGRDGDAAAIAIGAGAIAFSNNVNPNADLTFSGGGGDVVIGLDAGGGSRSTRIGIGGDGVAIGTRALTNFGRSSLQTGNTAVGYEAGSNITNSSSLANTLIGFRAGDNLSRTGGTGSNNTVVGYLADVSENSVSVDGDKATVIGANAQSREDGVAIGYNANASANAASVAIGAEAVASNSSIAIGSGSNNSFFTEASGFNSVAIGDAAKATGVTSIAIGDNATASGTDGIAIGDGVSTTTGIVIGTSSQTDVSIGAYSLGGLATITSPPDGVYSGTASMTVGGVANTTVQNVVASPPKINTITNHVVVSTAGRGGQGVYFRGQFDNVSNTRFLSLAGTIGDSWLVAHNDLADHSAGLNSSNNDPIRISSSSSMLFECYLENGCTLTSQLSSGSDTVFESQGSITGAYWLI